MVCDSCQEVCNDAAAFCFNVQAPTGMAPPRPDGGLPQCECGLLPAALQPLPTLYLTLIDGMRARQVRSGLFLL